jgi:hypothetical protein
MEQLWKNVNHEKINKEKDLKSEGLLNHYYLMLQLIGFIFEFNKSLSS